MSLYGLASQCSRASVLCQCSLLYQECYHTFSCPYTYIDSAGAIDPHSTSTLAVYTRRLQVKLCRRYSDCSASSCRLGQDRFLIGAPGSTEFSNDSSTTVGFYAPATASTVPTARSLLCRDIPCRRALAGSRWAAHAEAVAPWTIPESTR